MALSSTAIQNLGFSQASGELLFKWDGHTYEINLEKNTSYVFSAQNIDLGENLMISVLDDNNNLLAFNKDSLGSEDPSINFTSNDSQKVKLIIEAQADSDNKGSIPYSISVNNLDQSQDPQNVDLVELSDEEFESKAKNYFKNITNFSVRDFDHIVGLATYDDNVISEDELDTFSYISQNLPSLLSEFTLDQSTLDYYSYIFSAAVGANAANAYWTGGVQEKSDRIQLGNLHIGSTSEQVDLLRRKWFRGEDLPLARIDGDAAANAAPRVFSYKYAQGPIFSGDVSFTQIAQGNAGTCYLLAGLASIAESNPSIIENVIVDNNDGTYGVRFYGYGSDSAWVTINSDLPIANKFSDSFRIKGSIGIKDSLEMAGSLEIADIKDPSTNILWAGFMEKAYAQVNETGLLRRAISENSYQSIEGGFFNVLDTITGMRSSELTDINDIVLNAQDSNPLFLGSHVIYSDGSRFNSKQEVFSAGFSRQLVSGHAYSIIGFDELSNGFVINNPWGKESNGSYDPLFTIPISQFESLLDDGVVSVGGISELF